MYYTLLTLLEYLNISCKESTLNAPKGKKYFIVTAEKSWKGQKFILTLRCYRVTLHDMGSKLQNRATKIMFRVNRNSKVICDD